MKSKKANFSILSAGMLTFISFVLITVMVIAVISIMKQTTMVCAPNYLRDNATDSANASDTATWYNNDCWQCKHNGTKSMSLLTNGTFTCVNAVNTTASTNELPLTTSGYAWNATKNSMDAAILPTQFASVIVVVLVVVGILALLATVGYTAYRKMKE